MSQRAIRPVDLYTGDELFLSDQELTGLRKAFGFVDARVVAVVAEVQARRTGGHAPASVSDDELTEIARDYLWQRDVRAAVREARRGR